MATTISTGVQQVTKGNYVADIVINSFVNGVYTGWTVNGATSFNHVSKKAPFGKKLRIVVTEG